MKKLKLLTAGALLLVLAACGGKEPTKQVTEEKTPQAKELIDLGIVALGESMAEIAFEPATVSIPANSRVKLLFINKSEAEGMLHNFVLVALGSGQEIAAKGLKAGKANNFVPKDDRVIVNTPVLSMGETTIIEFDAPPKGSYHYICTYPGHINMVGRLNVE